MQIGWFVLSYTYSMFYSCRSLSSYAFFTLQKHGRPGPVENVCFLLRRGVKHEQEASPTGGSAQTPVV